MIKLKPFVANKILQKSLEVFYLYDKALTRVKFTQDAKQTKIIEERAYTHRLAVYLELLLRKHKFINCGLSVDCEYSNFIDDSKTTINFDPINGTNNNCYPDIVVHKRFDPDINLIIIEAKKAVTDYLTTCEKCNQPNPLNEDEEKKHKEKKCSHIKNDLIKLKAFAERYQFAYFVLFCKDSAKFWQISKSITDDQINSLTDEIKSYGSHHKISA